MSDPARRCVLLFSRASSAEGVAKGMRRAEPLFALAQRRVAAATAALEDTDLLLVGDGPASFARRLRQRGRSFGERLANAFADARALGYREVVAVPSDVPGLDRLALEQAFAALAGGRGVLGPSPDGGVYLIGVRGDAGPALEGVAWCTPSVFRQLQARLLALGEEPALLAPLRDVDAPRDLRLLAQDAAGDPLLLALLRALLTPAVAEPARPWLAARSATASSARGRAPPPALAA